MKTNFYKLAVVALALLLANCADHIPSGYTLEFPPVPEAWVSILGEPHWRVEWFAPDGRAQSADILPGGSLHIELPTTWANPVIARPYWPGLDLYAGFFMPAGALFPFDAKGSRLCLSWEAGPDAVFYRELVWAAGRINSPKNPANFDWPRFRELFQSGNLREEVEKDPWLVDWQDVAERTIDGNFLQSRLKPQQSDNKVNPPVPPGPWYGTSPFAEPLVFEEQETPTFEVRPGLNLWISREGVLRVDGEVSVFKEWQAAYGNLN